MSTTRFVVHLTRMYSDGDLSNVPFRYDVYALTKEEAVGKAYRKAYKPMYGFDKTDNVFIVTSVRKAPVRKSKED